MAVLCCVIGVLILSVDEYGCPLLYDRSFNIVGGSFSININVHCSCFVSR